MSNATSRILEHVPFTLHHIFIVDYEARRMILFHLEFRVVAGVSDGPITDPRKTPGIHTLNPLLRASYWWSSHIYPSPCITGRMTATYSWSEPHHQLPLLLQPCVLATITPHCSAALTCLKATTRPPRTRSTRQWPGCDRRVRGPPARCPWTRTRAATARRPSPPQGSRESGGPWTPSSSGLRRSAGVWRIWTQIWRTQIWAKYSVRVWFFFYLSMWNLL